MPAFNEQDQTVGVQVNVGEKKPPFRPIICIDFDGVLHSYTSGWKGAGNIPDAPVPGAIEWLNSIMPDLSGIDLEGQVKPVIYSSRSKDPLGVVAMKTWLIDNGFDRQHIQNGALDFPTQKPPAFLTIDDRAMCFTGVFPTIETMRAFKPWYQKESALDKPAGTYNPTELITEIHGELCKSEVNIGYVKALVNKLRVLTNEQKSAIREAHYIAEHGDRTAQLEVHQSRE